MIARFLLPLLLLSCGGAEVGSLSESTSALCTLEPVYDDWLYLGCISSCTGNWLEITELGCHGSGELDPDIVDISKDQH